MGSEGEGSPDLNGFPQDMPGVSSRITHDRHLGVFIGISRPDSVAAVKLALMKKFKEKAHLICRGGATRDMNETAVGGTMDARGAL